MICATAAFGPTTAIDAIALRSSGRIPLLARSTVPIAPALRINSRWRGSSIACSSPEKSAPKAPTRSASCTTRPALAAIADRCASPLLAAATSFEPRSLAGPGISRSRPALIATAVDRVPVQSVKSPLLAQDFGQEAVILPAKGPVEPVVGCHDGPRLGLAYGNLEGS